jgi:ParB family chromosome partitioning protein
MTLAAENTAEKTIVEKIGEKPMDKPMDKPLEKRKALGRGLESLLPGPRAVTAAVEQAYLNATAPAPEISEKGERWHQVLQLKLEDIDPNPYQTRSQVSDEYMAELTASIRANGVLQPVTVRPGENGRYLLIAGECRWKASAKAGKPTIPAVIRGVSNLQAMELTIIENLMRQDLNCFDQARAFGRLSEEFQLTQNEISLRTGVERSTVANYMRMLKLPAPVLTLLQDGKLEFGHAKILLGLRDPQITERVAVKAAEDGTSVRALEQIVYNINVPEEGGRKPGEARYVDPNVRQAERTLEQALGVRVKIKDRSGRGSILIEYKSLEDFDRVVEMLKGSR